MIGLWAQHEVNCRLAADKLFAFGLGDATCYGNRHPAAGGLFHLLQLAKFGIDLFGRLFADVAGVEDDKVGVFGPINRRIAEGAQDITHAFGIIYVHLAAIGPDKETFGGLCGVG